MNKKMKAKPEILETIDVVRKEDGKVHVFGRSGGRVFSPSPYLHYITHDANSGEIIQEDSFKSKDNSDLVFSFTFSLLGVGLPFFINELRPSNFKNRRKAREYYNKVHQFKNANMADLREAVKDIKVYQGTIEEVSEDLGKGLERIDTGKPETFIKGKDTFWLRVKAHIFGADAVVHYQPGSSIGTPVRYINKST